jgi:uncharacterized protein (DUF433 family)
MSNIVPISGVTKDENILNGEPILANTRTPVRAIIEMRRLFYTSDEIVFRLPHLNLEQVNTAIEYYGEHRAEIDAYIESNRVPHYLIESLAKNR